MYKDNLPLVMLCSDDTLSFNLWNERSALKNISLMIYDIPDNRGRIVRRKSLINQIVSDIIKVTQLWL